MRFKHLTIILLVIAADQAAKYAARHLLPLEGVSLVPGWLSFEMFLNPGIAFSIPFPTLLTTILTIVLGIGFTTWGIWRKSTAAVCMGAGGLSNALDRIIFAVTVDYIHIGPWSYLNLADFSVILGLALFLFSARKPSPTPHE